MPNLINMLLQFLKTKNLNKFELNFESNQIITKWAKIWMGRSRHGVGTREI